MTDLSLGGATAVRPALANPDLIPPPAPAGPLGTVAWLRATVSRFSTGAAHARRRALIETELARVEPSELRTAVAATTAGDPRHRVVRTLAEALGLPDPDGVARAIATISPVYFGGEDPAADAAVTWLLSRFPADDPEVVANRICLLVQAGDATAALAERAGRTKPSTLDDPMSTMDIEDRLAVALRDDPPAPVLRRVAARDTRVGGVAIPAGTTVLLDITAANRSGPSLSFGGGLRPCPGAGAAIALAAGLLEGPRPPLDEAGAQLDEAAARLIDPAEERRDPTTQPDKSTMDHDEFTTDEVPATDDRDPAIVVAAMVSHVLALARTWPNWDGRPCPIDDRLYTPHKAIRRVTDHLVDHLAELEARRAGHRPRPDEWHASGSLTPADLSPFTPADLDEAASRLTRLSDLWRDRLADLSPEELDHSPGEGWTFRQLAFHLEGSIYYADAVGSLTPPGSENPAGAHDDGTP